MHLINLLVQNNDLTNVYLLFQGCSSFPAYGLLELYVTAKQRRNSTWSSQSCWKGIFPTTWKNLFSSEHVMSQHLKHPTCFHLQKTTMFSLTRYEIVGMRYCKAIYIQYLYHAHSTGNSLAFYTNFSLLLVQNQNGGSGKRILTHLLLFLETSTPASWSSQPLTPQNIIISWISSWVRWLFISSIIHGTIIYC